MIGDVAAAASAPPSAAAAAPGTAMGDTAPGDVTPLSG